MDRALAGAKRDDEAINAYVGMKPLGMATLTGRAHNTIRAKSPACMRMPDPVARIARTSFARHHVHGVLSYPRAQVGPRPGIPNCRDDGIGFYAIDASA